MEVETHGDREVKSVFVDLEDVGCATPKYTFDISIDSSSNSKPDLQLLFDGMVAKKPYMSNHLRNGLLSFKVESVKFPGRYVDIGDTSPVKDVSIIQCKLIRQSKSFFLECLYLSSVEYQIVFYVLLSKK